MLFIPLICIDKLNKEEILKFLADSGTIDLAYVQEQIEMKKREEILQNHRYSIWYSERENAWYTTLSDDSKKTGRKNIKRKNRKDLEKAIAAFYISQDKADKKGKEEI